MKRLAAGRKRLSLRSTAPRSRCRAFPGWAERRPAGRRRSAAMPTTCCLQRLSAPHDEDRRLLVAFSWQKPPTAWCCKNPQRVVSRLCRPRPNLPVVSVARLGNLCLPRSIRTVARKGGGQRRAGLAGCAAGLPLLREAFSADRFVQAGGRLCGLRSLCDLKSQVTDHRLVRLGKLAFGGQVVAHKDRVGWKQAERL